MKRSLEQNKKLHELLNELSISMVQKQDLVFYYTNGKHTSSADMSYDECGALINSLYQMARRKTPAIKKIIPF